jgi:hypothetical protein
VQRRFPGNLQPEANRGESWQPVSARNGHSAMKKQIAIVEDEPALRENRAALARHGY